MSTLAAELVFWQSGSGNRTAVAPEDGTGTDGKRWGDSPLQPRKKKTDVPLPGCVNQAVANDFIFPGSVIHTISWLVNQWRCYLLWVTMTWKCRILFMLWVLLLLRCKLAKLANSICLLEYCTCMFNFKKGHNVQISMFFFLLRGQFRKCCNAIGFFYSLNILYMMHTWSMGRVCRVRKCMQRLAYFDFNVYIQVNWFTNA